MTVSVAVSIFRTASWLNGMQNTVSLTRTAVAHLLYELGSPVMVVSSAVSVAGSMMSTAVPPYLFQCEGMR